MTLLGEKISIGLSAALTFFLFLIMFFSYVIGFLMCASGLLNLKTFVELEVNQRVVASILGIVLMCFGNFLNKKLE